MPRPYVLGEPLTVPGLPPWDGTGIPLPVDDTGWPVVPDAADPPVLTALEPAEAAITDPDFEGHIRGTGFTEGTVIVWNNADEPTTFVDATDVWTLVVPSAVTAPTVLDVYVRNADGQVSNVLPFTWTAGAEAQSAEAAQVDGSATSADEEFDPSEHTVAEVQAYLDGNPDQTDYVLDRERAGKARTTLIGA
jgi:hypothetical protein